MSLITTFVVLAIIGSSGAYAETPICSQDDLRVQRSELTFEQMVEKWPTMLDECEDNK